MQSDKWCEHFDVSMPNLDPVENLRALMATRNERKLYKRKCDFSGEEIISAYPPGSPFKVYKNKIWWGDSWEGLDYGRDFNFNESFFSQFAKLQELVPREGTSVYNSENCDFNSHIRESKNCYLCSLIAKSEDLLYCHWLVGSKDCLDSIYTNYSTLCYECGNLDNCYNCILLWDSNNCHDSFGSYQLRNCDHCLFSNNLINKSYHIANKPVSKEEFNKTVASLLNGSWETWQEFYKNFDAVTKNAIHRASHFVNCENCSGDYLYDCKNCWDCFQGKGNEDCTESASIGDSKDVYFGYSIGWPRCELIYESSVLRGCTDCAFCTYTWLSNNLRYCDSCVSCEDCFGCIGLHHKKNCILNKQYSKEEYQKRLVEIIEYMKKNDEWGKFFPPQLSVYAYNETAAHDYFPLPKEDAIKRGYKWREKDVQEYLPATIQTLPDEIHETTDSITKEVLACDNCKKNYKIVTPELEFYRKMQIPLPRQCPECRHQRRFQRSNPYQMFDQKCNKCSQQIKSTYAPNRTEKIYCDECYLKEIY